MNELLHTRHLFLLPDFAHFDKKDKEAIYNSYADMRTLHMCRFPYPKITLGMVDTAPPDEEFPFPVEFHVDLNEWSEDGEDGKAYGFFIHGMRFGPAGKPKAFKYWDETKGLGDPSVKWFVDDMVIVFLVLLATRNIVKETRRNKMAKFGVGKQKHEYVTTLKIGQITEYEYEDGTPSGRHVRAHLRRGHIRHQAHGPGRLYHKTIFVEPVFVNSDREFVPREAYNVTGLANAGFRTSKTDLRSSERPGVLRPADGAGDRQDEDRHPLGGAPLLEQENPGVHGADN